MRAMSGRLLFSAASSWLLLLAVMFANGVVRVALLQPRLGEETARQAATLAGVALVAACSYFYVRRVATFGSRELLRVGTVWLALTLAFEFGFGRASGKGWDELFADYDLARGRLWPLVLLTTLLAPWAWGRALGRSGRTIGGEGEK